MSNQIISINQRTPEDLIAYMAGSYLPDQTETLAEVNHLFRRSIDQLRIELFNDLQKEPRFKEIINHSKLIQDARTPKQKMIILGKILGYRHSFDPRAVRRSGFIEIPRDDLREFGRLAGIRGSLLAVLKMPDRNLFDSMNLKFVPQEEIGKALVIVAEWGSQIVKNLLPHAAREDLPDALNSAIKGNKFETGKHILNTRTFDTNSCLINASIGNKPNFIRSILKAGGYSTTYCPNAGLVMRENRSTGLQVAIISAVDYNNPDALEILLTEGHPSREILEHARDRAIFCDIYLQAQTEFPDEPLIGRRSYRLFTEDVQRARANELRAQVPERFRNEDAFLSISRGDRAAIIQRLNEEIDCRFLQPSIAFEGNLATPAQLLAAEEPIHNDAPQIALENGPQAVLLADAQMAEPPALPVEAPVSVFAAPRELRPSRFPQFAAAAAIGLFALGFRYLGTQES